MQENHTGVAISVTPKGRAQATVVSTAVLDGKVGFASRGYTVKVKNIQRTVRATVTVIKLDTRRYVTVEGPASIEPWQDTKAHIRRLKDLYVAMGRAPKGTDEEFAQQMREEERNMVLVTPERLYGSLRSGA
ncbi:MAG: pyridoxamine 5'-phosphate oxidase family protein [Deltaproteobacteria bacterium]|nr:pyridoxamine 5'-phosphate oxidase family protein [Deltaproteobacteria bacterium]MBI2231124.1 pyridoxamine 5'-phosphate oxidase family protein [Deltaproteobacteria bacterium]MBI2367625.1 pyridoxamine 5'-phosphate oxidase family protein [Deltaproteobacteria bacterium]MBI3065591.1 pyridoxamine 5'-phosphate oxidase family protein [Deltaproteobacteria bacterium]